MPYMSFIYFVHGNVKEKHRSESLNKHHTLPCKMFGTTNCLPLITARSQELKKKISARQVFSLHVFPGMKYLLLFFCTTYCSLMACLHVPACDNSTQCPVLCLQEILMERFSGNAPGVNSLQPGDLFDVALSKKDSSLGLSVTVLFDKVFTLFLFFPFPLISPLFAGLILLGFGPLSC